MEVEKDECEVVESMVDKLVKDNASAVQDQTKYKKIYDELCERYDKAANRIKVINKEIKRKESQKFQIEQFIKSFNTQQSVITEFNEKLWNMMVDNVTINHEGNMNFRFISGKEVLIKG